MSQKYPVGIETFSDIIQGGYAYVDKTEVIYNLIQAGKFFFLSRPRRFGKSLMLSTMEAYFEGRRELFNGLWLGLAQGVDWSPRPVLRLNFVDADASDTESVKALIANHLDKWEQKYGININQLPLGQRFHNVIQKAAEVSGSQVAVLIDEYDKVLVNTMHDPEMHEAMKAILKPVFAVLKGADRYIQFGILTGVSRFSKLSIFSDLNNIRDISLSDEFCTICGITEDELKTGFKNGIQEFADHRNVSFDEMTQILKDNYDGYHFSEKCPDIYNPFSLINAFAENKILHRWFESGTPTFLLKRIVDMNEDLKQIFSPATSGATLASQSITDDNLTAILYQTGYLTIKEYDEEDDTYILGIPNKEVETGIYRGLLPIYSGRDASTNDGAMYKLRKAVRAGDAVKFIEILKSFLAGIPYHLSEGKHEIYYENNIYVILRLLGCDIRTEEETSNGRIDAVLKTPEYIYILELKLNGNAQEAMQQIIDKRYDLPYLADGRQLIRIGLSFSKETRTIADYIID